MLILYVSCRQEFLENTLRTMTLMLSERMITKDSLNVVNTIFWGLGDLDI